jgi:hypothetical protein
MVGQKRNRRRIFRHAERLETSLSVTRTTHLERHGQVIQSQGRKGNENQKRMLSEYKAYHFASGRLEDGISLRLNMMKIFMLVREAHAGDRYFTLLRDNTGTVKNVATQLPSVKH